MWQGVWAALRQYTVESRLHMFEVRADMFSIDKRMMHFERHGHPPNAIRIFDDFTP